MPPITRLPVKRISTPSTWRPRTFSSVSRARSSFATGPAPPRLPEKDQRVFEDLQKSSTGAFSTPRPVVNQSPDSASPTMQAEHQQETPSSQPASSTAATNPSKEEAVLDARVQATGDGEELHPDIRRGAKPEFEGDRNPKTGEIGGPKNDPLRWGGDVDWSYNGRVTDF